MPSLQGWAADHAMRRVMLTLALVTAMLESVWLILGAPDVARSLAFFTAGTPTLGAGEALTALVAWALVVVAVSVVMISAIRGFGRSRAAQHASAKARLLLAAGLLLFALGAMHRLLPSPTACCGSSPAAIREAIQLAQ
jgi:hypothetical protein